MEEIFHVCLDHCSALHGLDALHAYALVGHSFIFGKMVIWNSRRCPLWSRTPGPYTDAFRLLGDGSCGPCGHPSRVPSGPTRSRSYDPRHPALFCRPPCLSI